MGLVALDALFLSYLLVALLGLFLDYDWAHRVQELHTIRYLSSLVSRLRLFAMDVTGVPAGRMDSASGIKESSLSGGRNEEDRGLISATDLEIVMERMGSLRSCCDGWHWRRAMEASVAGVSELRSMFDEQEPSLDEVMEAFCMFDRNGDGFISAEELQRVLSSLGFREGRPTSLDDCGRMIVAYDENRDGRIDPHEFVKLMERSFC